MLTSLILLTIRRKEKNSLLLFRVFTEWLQYYNMLVTAHIDIYWSSTHIYLLATPHTGGMVKTCLLMESEDFFSLQIS